MSTPRRARILARLRPGRPIRETVSQAELALRGAGWTVDHAVVKRKRALRRATMAAVRDGVDCVIVVGGDGAVGQVATKLAGHEPALGVIPTGTGNLLAKNLGIPLHAGDAIKVIAEGAPRTIDVGRVRAGGKRRVFTVACGIGFDAEVMAQTTRTEKLHWGSLGYVANAIGRSRKLRQVRHVLVLDGTRVELKAAQVFVANLGRMMPLLEPQPPIVPDDGLLDVVVIAAGDPFRAVLAGWEAMNQDTFGRSKGGHVFRSRARKIRIKTKPSRLVEIDGSVIGRTPADVTVLPGALRVLTEA